MIIAGVDFSMTSPAICLHYGDSWHFNNCAFHFCNDNKKLQSSGQFYHSFHKLWSCPEERFYQLSEWARSVLAGSEIKLLALEGYAMGAKGLVFQIGENTGQLKRMMWEEKIPFIVPAPTLIKKFASGKGNSNKEAMEAAFVAETGFDVRVPINQTKGSNPSSDIIDSYFLAKYAFMNQ